MMPTEGPSDLTESVLQGIYERNLLRVGFFSNRLPFVFDNRTGDLVGFDVEMAYQLSRDLGVDLKFYLAEIGELPSLLSSGKIDIAMTGFAVTPDRAAAMLFSMPYLDETLAFVVRDHLRDRFSSWAEIRTLESVRIGIVNVPYYIKQIRDRVPEGKIEVFEIPNILDQIKRFDAIVVPAETGSVLTLLNPQFTVVVPQPEILRVPLAYPIARRDHDWAHFINTWIDLKRKDGSLDRLYQHWILGESAKEETPRWSIIRNVLGWL
jgi:ABC-type amino acid transport substrate-binding protein